MNPLSVVEHSLDGTLSRSALLMLGAHWLATNIPTCTLGYCGAWVGEASNPIGANAGFSPGFRGHRDMRETCDRLPLAAEADWWKAARFAPEEILHAVEDEERTRFEREFSVLDELVSRELKEPRLRPSTPVSRYLITNPNCIHIAHNPLEVARPFQMSDELIEQFNALGAIDIEKLDEEPLHRLLDTPLHYRRAKGKELSKFSSLPQLALWQAFHHGRAFGFEAGRHALQHLRVRPHGLNDAPATRSRTIFDLQRGAAALTVERDERQATVSAHEATIATHEATIADLQRQIAGLTADRDERQATTSALEATVEARDAAIRARDGTIRDLLDSTSWKVTEPLRVASRSFRRCLRAVRRALRLLHRSGNGQVSHAGQSFRLALVRSRARVASRKPASPSEPRESVSALIRESKQRQSPSGSRKLEALANKRRLKVSVIAWDLAHNPLGRAYLIADVLRNDYDVEIIGSTFPDFGSDIWKPLRDCSRVPIRSAPGDDFPAHFRKMQAIAEHIEGDVLFVSKPRLPSLELAILAKIKRNRPIILDIDDHELGFFENRTPLSLDELRVGATALDIDIPYGESWTRYCESLIPHVEQITVSNEELRKRYGGTILPHVRDERDFDPTLYPRDAIRQALGFTSEDKVILFAGTPRRHKGLSRLVAALKELDRPDYKLLLVGSPADGAVTNVLRGVDPRSVTLLSDVPFSDLPGYLCTADLVTLLQDEEAPASTFQMPAKFTDALSMGIPVLASNVPPLMNLADEGLVELLGHASPAQKIDEMLSNHPTRVERATENRQTFLRAYSYRGAMPALIELIQRCTNHPKPIPNAFRDLVSYHQNTFGMERERYRTIPRVRLSKQPRVGQERAKAALAQRRIVRARRRAKQFYVDDKLDIVFFWKQNDSGIYGRRQDMFVKYLAQDPRVGRIFHFDAPVSVSQSTGRAYKAASGGRYSHARLVGRQTLKRKLGFANASKIKRDTFVYLASPCVPGVLRRVIPTEHDYLEFLSRAFRRHRIGQRRTILWVCPVNFHFPAIEELFDADLVVADVIDDQRQWPARETYREKLSRNYEGVLGLSDLVLTNCESVYQSMGAYSHNTHLLPNAVELLEEESRSWRKPRELRRFTGPVIGYVGNLDIARIDLNLLRGVVSERPSWNFVFIGSMHRGGEIRELEKYENVHFLGVRVYEKALRYIRHFDAALIPHLDNGLTKSMNPLKLYVYQSLLVPVVSTPIANIGDFGEFVRIGRTPQDFVREIEDCLRNNPLQNNLPRLRTLLSENSWPERVKCVLDLIEKELAKPQKSLSLVSQVNFIEADQGLASSLRGEESCGRSAAGNA